MKKLSLMALLCAAPFTFAAERGEIAIPAATEVPKLCEEKLGQLKQSVSALQRLPLDQAKPATVLVPWNRTRADLDDFWGAVYLMANVHPDAALRQAEDDCNLKIEATLNEVLQNNALYQRFKAVKPADEIDAETLKGILAEFENKGVNLAPAGRAKAAELFKRLAKLEQDFQRNLRENKTKLAFSAEQLKGVPEAKLTAYPRDSQGRYQIGLDYPDYFAVMEQAESSDTRRQFYTAYINRGGKKNLAILHEVINLRKQLATLLGYPSFAAFATRNNMVGKPEVVQQFLDKVKDTVTAVEKRELAELAQEKARHTGQAQAKMLRWDLPFYEQRLKKSRYAVDQDEVRAQFATQPTIDWMMAVTSRLYGVEFRPNLKLPVWHETVKGYDVYDAGSKEYLSSFYLDLFPRDGKYKHAAAFTVRQVSTLEGRTPVSALVTNFSDKGFDQGELDTLFHEFGHIMHGVLSRTRYTLNAGTSTRRDFVEAPSQMYEEWSRHPESLKLWNEVCSSCKPIDPQLIKRMNEARLFGQGTRYARQWLYAAFDMKLAGPIPQDPLKQWIKMEQATPLGHVEGTQFPGSFGHIVGGYAAGYYGYMWSEVLALDMRSAFKDQLMDPAVGQRFRKIVLENGSQRPEMELVRNFLGREPSSDAFFKEITGQSALMVGEAK
ncbi:M3 family metallopeptidase [Chitinimonas lacunae]|uniref:M3 family metallopeptidase n=1 Tax=Chitinimonas lacunae TaxID=1963018 RepID=A0ABV8MWN9_9NEIS